MNNKIPWEDDDRRYYRERNTGQRHMTREGGPSDDGIDPKQQSSDGSIIEDQRFLDGKHSSPSARDPVSSWDREASNRITLPRRIPQFRSSSTLTSGQWPARIPRFPDLSPSEKNPTSGNRDRDLSTCEALERALELMHPTH
jgi:hypothetical protein